MAAATECGGKLLARLGVKPQLSELEPVLFPGGPKQGSVYEFYGEEGSGKSQVMLHLVSRCLLPVRWLDYHIAGQGVGVVLVDNHFHFSILRVTAMMEKQVMMQVKKQTPEKLTDENFMLNMEHLLQNCLRNLHVIQCTSLTNMLITMATLDKLFSSNSNTCVLMIDSISIWYNSSDVMESKKYFPKLVGKLESLVETYRLVVFVSKSALFTKDCYYTVTSSNIAHLKHNEYLGNIWSRFVTFRLIFLVSSRLGHKTFCLYKEHGFDKQEALTYDIREEGLHFTSNKCV